MHKHYFFDMNNFLYRFTEKVSSQLFCNNFFIKKKFQAFKKYVIKIDKKYYDKQI